MRALGDMSFSQELDREEQMCLAEGTAQHGRVREGRAYLLFPKSLKHL